MGINPYPHRFDVSHYSKDIINNFVDPADDEQKEKSKEVIISVAGRIMAIRKMGKACFVHIKDEQGKIQLYIRKDDVGEESYNLLKLLDIGDIIGAAGYVFRTKTGEVSIHCNTFSLLTKSLHPLPVVKEEILESGEKIVYDAFADVELRYRQRYIDLIVNDGVKE
ncbi:unnamed protein product, partial [Rotaria sp. Silwood1]